MSVSSLGILALQITGDSSGLQAAMAKAGTAEQQAEAQTQKLTTAHKALTATLSIAGAIGGAAFGAMLAGANQLNAATTKLGADTGLSGAALQQQGQAIDSLYKNSLQSMDSIESSLATVISGFHLTGQAADDLTAQFLTYEDATGQGSEAVTALKQVTDAYNLSASDEGNIMDLLVASHQQYATSISADQSALAAMAPALDAMGMGLSDGVNLLNLFASAGIDASKAPMALQKAVKELKPGQNLNDLIAQISSITDPTQRAQAAMTLFGVRGGAQLAQALKPGITSLSQYATSASDTVGATQRAGAAVDSSFGNQFTLIMHNVGGALDEVGTHLGPLVMMGSIAGPKILMGFSSLAGALVPVITRQLGLAVPAAAAGGTAQGVAAGEAEVTAEAAAIEAGGPEIGAAVASDGAEAAAGGSALGAAAGAAAATALAGALVIGIPAAFIAGMAQILPNLNDAWKSVWNSIPFLPKNNLPSNPSDLLNNIQAGSSQNFAASWRAGTGDAAASQAAQAQAKANAKAADDAVRAQIIADAPAIAQAAKDGYVGIPTWAEAEMFEANVKVQQGLAAQITSVKNWKSALAAVWTDTLSATTDAATISYREDSALADIADTQKQLADKKTYAKLTQQQKDALHEQLITQQSAYASLLEEGATYGTNAQKVAKLAGLLQSQALLQGLASADPDTRAMWEQVEADTQTQLDQLKGIANTGGLNVATALADGMIAGLSAVQQAAYRLMSGANTYGAGGAAPQPGQSGPWAGSGTAGASSIYQYDEGGVVAGAIGQPQLAVVHGGETVLRAGQSSSSGGGRNVNVGGITVPVTITGNVTPATGSQLGRQVAQVAGRALVALLQEENSRMVSTT